MNNICIMGRLTHDPELRNTSSGVEVVNFSVAVDRKYKSGDEKVTDFIDCQAWRQTAVFIDRYFNKGKMIAVTGSLQTENYTDKNGNKRKKVYINVESVDFCGSKSDNDGGQSAPAAYSAPAPAQAAPSSAPNLDVQMDDDDELPF